MQYIKIIVLSVFLLNISSFVYAQQVYFVDMKKLLNESKAGKNAQDYLRKKFETENKKLEKEGATLKKEENDLIAKKKIKSPEEYKKGINSLREKSINFQKKRRQSSSAWVGKKNEARTKLVSALQPILQKYMQENNVQMIVDKKHILLANSNFDLTDKILKILDKQIKSIDLK